MKYPDPLGCYRVGDLKFYSKLEAIEMHTKTGTHPHWDFNEAVFSSYDWTIEPSEHILELYKQRAEQLREKYDYIVLMYSGGADSQTVLESFIDNDIKLDEIATYINYDGSDNKNDFLNSEAFKVSIPKAQELIVQYPWLNHRVIDLTQLTMDKFNLVDTKFNWIYEQNMYISPNNNSRDSLPLKIKEWADLINAGKKVCILWGKDKPRVQCHDGKFFLKFIDFVDDAATVKSIAGEQPYTDEFFYWTPDMPKLVIKQGHLIKNYLSRDLVQLPFISTERSDLAYREINNQKYWLSNHGVHQLIYPKWDISTFSAGKAGSVIFTPRDIWFFQLETAQKARQNWQVGLEKFWELIPPYWRNHESDLSKGIKACWSKDYYLGKINV